MSQTKAQLVSNIVGDVAGGANFTGVVTSTQFSGNITGVAATFTGNVSIAGTLTYEDVTNIDSIGLVTARSGIEVSGIITARAGYAVTYYGDGSGLTGVSSWDSYDTWLFGGS
jgi:hypothetical protein